MSEQPDPERLLAEALRAKALRASPSRPDPPSAPVDAPTPAPPATPPPSSNGSDARSAPEHAEDTGSATKGEATATGAAAGRPVGGDHDLPPAPEQLHRLLAGNGDEPDLLSGRASDTVAGMRAVGRPASVATGPVTPMPGQTTQLRSRPRPVPVWWIVLLAVLLGLAAGAVVGLVSIT